MKEAYEVENEDGYRDGVPLHYEIRNVLGSEDIDGLRATEVKVCKI